MQYRDKSEEVAKTPPATSNMSRWPVVPWAWALLLICGFWQSVPLEGAQGQFIAGPLAVIACQVLYYIRASEDVTIYGFSRRRGSKGL